MRKMTTRIMAVTMATVMAASMAGCSSSSTSKDTESEATTQMTGLANPMTEVPEDEMMEQTGIDLPAPEGATDVTYYIIDEGDDGMIAQMNFTLNGDEMYLRACSTDLTELNSTDEDADAEEVLNTDSTKADISGLNYEWDNGGTWVIQERDAFYNVSKDGAGYIAWLDVVPGILYNLCMEKGADYEKLTEYADEVFVPMQDEVDGDVSGDANSDFSTLLDDVYATKAGSAGSSDRVEAAATELCDFVTNYGEDITEQDMEALASEKLASMKEENGDDFVENFGEEFDAVVENAMSENEDLETDVAFNQVVNAVSNQLEALQ